MVHRSPLHPGQSKLVRTKKRSVLNWGRRAGKTYFFSQLACDSANQGRRVLYGAPQQSQTDAFWSYVTSDLAQAISAGYVGKNQVQRKLEFPGGGIIHARTAWDVDSWRGGYGDLVILDEYAWNKEDPWGAAVQPMLLDNDGDVWFGSTPNRKNWHYQRVLDARTDPDRWQYEKITTYENPHLTPEAIAELQKDMTEKDFAQEIMAEFVEGYGAVFTVTPENFWVPEGDHSACRKLMCLDLAKVQDFTAISIGCQTHKVELYLGRMRGPAGQQAIDIRAIWLANQQPEMHVEDNAAADVIKALADLQVPFSLIHTDGNTKPKMVASLKLALERKTWRFVDDPVGRLELESYEEFQSPSGNMKYSAPTGQHDDTVVARAIMTYVDEFGQFTLL